MREAHVHLGRIVYNLETIKKNMTRYKSYPDVLKMVERKRSILEDEFLYVLQLERLTGYSETYALYHNWYKQYKGVEEL